MERFVVNIAERFGDQLWGREEGKDIRDKIIDEFVRQDKPVLLMNFSGVSRIDFSCASEIVSIIVLRLSGELRGRHVILAELSRFVEENISVALDKAELCCVVLSPGDSWRLIGKCSDTLFQTFNKVVQLKHVDTPTLSDALDITITSCNNRLKTLVNLGMIRREELSAISGGNYMRTIQFYESVLPPVHLIK